jgi:hypothetical protein
LRESRAIGGNGISISRAIDSLISNKAGAEGFHHHNQPQQNTK